MKSPTVSLLLSSSFTIARAKYNDEYKAWIDLSFRLSGRFNLVPAIVSLQREGDLDLVLRCLEDEQSTNKGAPEVGFAAHYQMMFSEAWIMGCYEILRAFRQRDSEAATIGKPTSGVSDLDEFKSIFSDFELLRVPFAKFEVAKDNKLKQPLPMQAVGNGDTNPIEFYDPNDPNRFHITPRGMSARGSAMWLAVDGLNLRQHWVERRDLADRLLSLAKLVKGAGELEAEQKHMAQTKP